MFSNKFIEKKFASLENTVGNNYKSKLCNFTNLTEKYRRQLELKISFYLPKLREYV